jgi:exopolysaccharide production protein ExoY
MIGRTLPQRPTSSYSRNGLTRVRAILRPHAKRLFDIIGALALIAILLPLGFLILLALALTGQVPLYSHARLGRGGRKFGCLKFRSMRSNADLALAELLQRDPAAKLEWQTTHKLRHDPRVTRVGRFLRRTSLDELPQLLNILAGQMSFVGPRPVTEEELNKFYGSAAKAAYNSVRPGLTGPWQVGGRSESGFANRIALDTLYAQHPSLRTDLLILVQTIYAVFARRGAW